MKSSILYVLFLFIAPLVAHAFGTDYTLYHRQITEAENTIFIKNDPATGLKQFAKTFDSYDFVFVDDCIEAFELALYFKKEDLAIHFIKKAIANGFEPQLLNQLYWICGITQGVHKFDICQPFIKRHETKLQQYADSCYPAYLARLNKDLIAATWRRHVKEQLFKDPPEGLCLAQSPKKIEEEQHKAYTAVCDDNLRFMDSLARKGIYLGERNLGVYTLHLAGELHLPIIDNIRRSFLSQYHLPLNTYVPVQREDDYFDINPVYNMLFHNAKSYDTMVRYKDAAIKGGYMHPRELASLLYNGRRSPTKPSDMHLLPHDAALTGSRAEDALRAQYYLPSYACDSAKHAFAHEHGLMLCFGFRNGTR
jgi:hypothetical protein